MVVDASVRESIRPPTVEDHHAEMASLELSEHVPETVRSAFAVARMVWLYGWYYWPLHTVAGFHAYLCLDLALAIKSAQVDGHGEPRGRTPTLEKSLKRAIQEHWISDAGIPQVQRLKARRQHHLESMPEEWLDDCPSGPEDAQKYCKVLLEIAPLLRNEFAHPKNYSHGLPGWYLLALEDVHGLISQLFAEFSDNNMTRAHAGLDQSASAGRGSVAWADTDGFDHSGNPEL